MKAQAFRLTYLRRNLYMAKKTWQNSEPFSSGSFINVKRYFKVSTCTALQLLFFPTEAIGSERWGKS